MLITKEWFTTTVCKIYWIFLFDFLSTIMFLVITTISMFVHIFSSYYLKEDPHVIRFFAFLSIFTFFMLFLVTAGSLIQVILGWEGVGLTSFLLINFWYTRIEANKAALKAVIINRIGDCALIVALGIFYNLLGTFDFLLIKYCINICF
jgi:NADH-ubiquinone oxidoreductase chain 5